MKKTDILIIGGGPAGLTAGLYGARAGLNMVILEKMFAGGQIASTHLVENYPGFPEGIGGVDIGMAMMAQAERFGVNIQYDTVDHLELAGDMKRVVTQGGQWDAPVVILAMGAQPRLLGIPREDELRGRGVSYCATCDGAFYRGKTVAVVGGGDTAVSDAIFLSMIAKKVYLIHRRDTLRATAVLQRHMLAAENIEELWNTQVEALLGEDTLTGLKLMGDHSEEIAVDGVFVAIGTTPQTELVKGQIDMDDSGAIMTNGRMQTNITGVYAAGDIRVTPLRQVVTAVADGAVAAMETAQYLLERS